MVTSKMALDAYGEPGSALEGNYMITWDVPAYIQQAFKHVKFTALGTVGFPKRIYCSRHIVGPLEKALNNLFTRGFADEMETWDGCYIIRNKRGSTKTWSLHAWGLAIDCNAATNRLGAKPTLSDGFVKCWLDAGFDWGGFWKTRPDGMHFQIASLR